MEVDDSIGYQSSVGQSDCGNVILKKKLFLRKKFNIVYLKQLEQTIMPYLNVLSKFRDEIRTEARLNKRTFLKLFLFYFC